MKRLGLLAALLASRPAPAGSLFDDIGSRLGGTGERLGIAADGVSSGLLLPRGATVVRDIAYGTDQAQRLDVYRPENADRAPLILFVHGGGWRRGDKAMGQMVNHKAPHWVSKGCIFTSANYRMLPAANPVEQADDISRAIAFAQSHAKEWGADPERLVLIGHSAGAHLVALLTADGDIAFRQGVKPWLATIAIDSAALDMDAIMRRPHYRFYDPVFGTDPAFWRQASPTHRMNGKPAAPMLLVCSSRREDSCPPAHEFAAKATALGGRATVLPIDLSHIQINDELGRPGTYTEAVDAFLRTVGVK